MELRFIRIGAILTMLSILLLIQLLRGCSVAKALLSNVTILPNVIMLQSIARFCGVALLNTLLALCASPVMAGIVPLSDSPAPSASYSSPAESHPSQASASAPQALLTTFFQQRLAGTADKVTVTLKTPIKQWPDCPQPLLTLTGNNKSWGELSVGVRCGQTRRFVRVNVQAMGNYLTASRAISRSEAFNHSNTTLTYGLLNALPPRPVLSLNQIQDAVALRNILPGQPITLSLLRQAWRVRAGQQVQVIVKGSGFNASGSGKALNNAAAAHAVRVRMPSGQIINGIASDDGSVLIIN